VWAELFRNVSARRKFLLVSVLVAVLGVQWFAVAHRGAHGAGRLLGLSASSTSTIFTGAFDEHPAGGVECLRLDSVLGAQALCGGVPEMDLHEAHYRLESVPPLTSHVVWHRILPPARAPPLTLI
jgi:hypothetical protein